MCPNLAIKIRLWKKAADAERHNVPGDASEWFIEPAAYVFGCGEGGTVHLVPLAIGHGQWHAARAELRLQIIALLRATLQQV